MLNDMMDLGINIDFVAKPGRLRKTTPMGSFFQKGNSEINEGAGYAVLNSLS